MIEVETNDSLASVIIKNDIERSVSKKDYDVLYQFMADNTYILYDMHSDLKTAGYYIEEESHLYFREKEREYYAIKSAENYFKIFFKDIMPTYTLKTLEELGIDNPEYIIIYRANISGLYKRIK